MADMNIDHAGTNACVEDMQSLARSMANSVEDLIAQLSPLSTSFTGAAASEFQSISRQRQQIYNELNQSFSGGANILDGMHQTMLNGDNKAAGLIS